MQVNIVQGGTLCFVFIFSAFLLLYFWLKNRCYNYWTSRNVPTPVPVNLLFGHVKDALFLKKNIAQISAEFYKNYPELRYIGFYKFTTPCLILRDVELIKNVLVGEFSNFHDNEISYDEKTDPLFGKNPFVANGNKWKLYRQQLTPNFTSTKMKAMFPTVNKIAQDLIQYIINNNGNDKGIDVKEVASCYTTENVFNCGFGIETNCFNDNANSTYRKLGRRIMDSSDYAAFQLTLNLMAPKLGKFLKIKMFDQETTNFFTNFIENIENYRKSENVKNQRNGDFFDNLLDLKSKDSKITSLDLAGHTMSFFLDGFETSAIALTFTLYELAKNFQAQEKLRNEIKNIENITNCSFDEINNLAYLDAVVKEALRLHPPLPFMMKTCTKQTKFPSPYFKHNEENEEILIEEGTVLIIPLFGLHFDEKYFPNAQEFKPERFLLGNNKSSSEDEEDKESFHKFAYLPFGEGPRICIGMRFGLLQVKVAVFNIISSFSSIKVNEETKNLLEVDPKAWLLSSKTPIYLDFVE